MKNLIFMVIATAVVIPAVCSARNPFSGLKNILSRSSETQVIPADSDTNTNDTDGNGITRHENVPDDLTEQMTNPMVNIYRSTDMTLMDLGWSLLNEKNMVETKFDKKYNLVIETKKEDSKAIVATDLPLIPEANIRFGDDRHPDNDVTAQSTKTILQFSYKVKDLNDKSRFGVVVNYVDDDNFDGIFFDKKQYYLVNCKGGKMFFKRSGKLNFEVSPVRIKFEHGKIDFYAYDKKFDNYLELWTINGTLKTEYIGFYVAGKNQLSIESVIAVQDVPLEDPTAPYDGSREY